MVVFVFPVLPEPPRELCWGVMFLISCGVILKIGSYTPCRDRSCCSANLTSSRDISMLLLFCNALRIASVSDSGTTLLLRTPTRVRSGNGGKGCGLISRKFGSWITGVIGVGSVVCVITGIPGGAVGGIVCWPGGSVAGLMGVGLGTCASTATDTAMINVIATHNLVSKRGN